MLKSLADCVRAKFALGILPHENPSKLWVSWGSGSLCAGCDEPIRAPQTEYELEFEREPSIRLHAECHGLWNTQRRRRRGRRRE